MKTHATKSLTKILKGIPASEGIAIGKALLLETPWDEIREISLKEYQLKEEERRYRQALETVALQLQECRERVASEIGSQEAKIFDAHLAILNDPFFQDDIPKRLYQTHKNVEFLLKSGLQEYEETFRRMENDYFRQRIDDIQDVALRILRALLRDEGRVSVSDDTVLISKTLTPSDTARIDSNKIVGIATETGGIASHASILARSKNIPAVVGVENLLAYVRPGCPVIIDGNAGLVHVNPPLRVILGYRRQKARYARYLKKLVHDIPLTPTTAEGERVYLYANVSMTADVSLAVRYNADGIGLFRTELPFLIAGELIDEEEQFTLYKTVVEAMRGRPVTIRTLDLGGDKFLPFQLLHQEKNPFMGWRSIRIFLQEKDLFKAQIRAILKASHYGPVRILYPMISSLEEILEIRTVFAMAQEELRKEGVPFDEQMPNGIMIEVPSAALCADRLIDHCDFFSIGTNDLIQYTLAVDRNNEKVSRFYQPTHPAVLRLIQGTIQAAKKAGKPVSLCGEMAGNPIYAPLFLGMGLRDFSMSPSLIPEVKERIRVLSISECEALLEKIWTLSTSEEIERFLIAFGKEANKRQHVPMVARGTP